MKKAGFCVVDYAVLWNVAQMCLAGVLVLHCNTSLDPAAVLYQPDVVLAGYINGTYDSLCGNPTWKNTCRLIGDTIRMYIHSKDFAEKENKVRTGDMIRLDIHPGHADTLIELGKVLFHLARYTTANRSYYVVPGDTAMAHRFVRMKVRSLVREPDGSVALDSIRILTPVLPGTYGENLEIYNARIFGRVKHGIF